MSCIFKKGLSALSYRTWKFHKTNGREYGYVFKVVFVISLNAIIFLLPKFQMHEVDITDNLN